MLPGGRGVSPKQMKAMMKRQGIEMDSVDGVEQVVVYTRDKEIVFRRPEVEGFLKGTGKAPVRSLVLKGWEGKKFSIPKVDVKARQLTLGRQQTTQPQQFEPPIAVTVDNEEPNSEHTIKVELLKVPEEARRTTSCELVIHTDDPHTPEIKIRATVYFPRAAASVTTTGAPYPTRPKATSPLNIRLPQKNAPRRSPGTQPILRPTPTSGKRITPQPSSGSSTNNAEE